MTTLIVGAGVSGLSCAVQLQAQGKTVRLLERARGVGGRCATRRLDELNEQPVDQGLTFVHGKDPAFLTALRSVPRPRLEGWPLRIAGSGRPCQPNALDPLEQRLAFSEGLNVFPKWLARDLAIDLGIEVTGLALDADRVILRAANGEVGRSREVVLALAVEQALRLLDDLAPAVTSPDLDVARILLRQERSLPCLAVIAAYRTKEVPPGDPPWDLLYPDDSTVLNLVANDSAKRPAGATPVLVLQAQPRWTRAWLGAGGDLATGAATLLAEAGRLIGGWAAAPWFWRGQRWSFARIGQASELSQPLLLTLPNGARLGVCGELFFPGGGLEGAFLSGRRLADRLAAPSDAASPALTEFR